MSEYTQMADTFLANAHAKMDIRFIGRAVNVEWDERNSDLRNLYDVTITTPRGSMSIRFWDSIHNTQITQMSVEEYAKRRFKAEYKCLTIGDRIKAQKELKSMQAEAKPTAYDVLACLTKYDCGSFDNFCTEYGYSNDSIRAMKTYLACCDEYRNLRRIFTVGQMAKLSEIN